MANDQFNPGTNWWDRTAAASSSSSSSSSSSGLNNSLRTFGWAPEMGDFKARPSMDSISPSSVSATSVVFQDNPKLQIGAADIHMMGLGLSSQAMDWNHSFMRGEEHNYEQEMLGFKHQSSSSQFSPHGSCSSDSTVINMDSTALYGLMLGSENQVYHHENRSINYQYGIDDQLLPNSWSKVPQFLRNSPPKHAQLHFSNNAPFWNPSAAASTNHNVRPPGFFPSLQQTQFPTANFDEKTKNMSEIRNSSTVVKKSGNETSSKRPRNENPSLPAFKVRKEKMGDRITALQQLVSPFGKTDTASVLSEAIEYIKFLHDQVNVLSSPYMKYGAATQHQQKCEKFKDLEVFKQDLRTRGLFLVPVSITFPVTHESTMDFWTPTFGGTIQVETKEKGA